MLKDEELMMKDDDFKLLRGFADRLTDGQTTIYNLGILRADSRKFGKTFSLGRFQSKIGCLAIS